MKNLKNIFAVAVLLFTASYSYCQDTTGILKRNNKTFVTAPDKGYTAHGNDALKAWGYWQVVENQQDADIIINFKVHRRTQTVKGRAEIIDAKTGKIIYTTDKIDTFWDMSGWNHKLLAIQKLVENHIRKYIETGKE